MKTEIKKLPKSEVEMEFELTAEEFQKHVDRALLHLKEHVKMDGFRKGKVPANMVEEKIGQENLLMEAGDLAVKATYPAFMEEQKLEPVGDPDVQIKKIVPIPKESRILDGKAIGTKESPFIFTVKVAVLPEITLPDYKEVTSQIKNTDIRVEEKEIEEALRYLQKSRAKFTAENRPAQNKDFVEIEYSNKDINSGKTIKDRFILGEGGFLKDFEDNIIGMKAGEEKEFTSKFPENAPSNLSGKEGGFKVKMLSVQKMELSEINDEFAKQLGVFDSLVALKQNLTEGITLEKTQQEKERKRGELLEKISAKTTFDIPEKMITFEAERLFEDLKNQVASQFKIPFEQYLVSVKKTEDEIKKNYRQQAEKRIKDFLVLRQIGKVEKIEVSPEEIEQDLQKLVKNYTPEQLKKIDIEQLKEYSKGAIYNEKVFEKLESFSK